ncbi:extracellular solute-binding protein [Acidianus sulfidivorans JP7]|uniref:ABC transporter substrate-binding protein n=1 Tax=Acidianus sulfidivorans JP7 TaxID=619593 RepID=A0A2U9INN5_9CREN|nr:extracellular solute-binding protein [Acidianus sulfidivorans]AWR97679.1 extracellular solute-binding protein [Acidianus sulfidivorans JP7]
MKSRKGLTKIQGIIIVVIVVIAIAGIAIVLTHKPTPTTTTTSTTITTPVTSTSSSQILTIYVAGAYKAIFDELASQFENQTGITVKVVPGGSFGLASEIATSSQPPQLFVPVAYIQAVELQQSEDAGWAIAFLSDQMSIVYSNYTTHSPYWNELYSNYTLAMKTNETTYWNNFFTLLATKFSLGISYPSSDPEGLYAYLILKMAGKLYSPTHSETYYISLANESHDIVGASTTADFVAPLEAGRLSFVFSYKSYAISQHLEYLQLPPWLSFGYYSNELSWDSSFSCLITVSGHTLNISGNPVYLYMTVPKNAADATEAYEFISFVLSHHSELAQFGVTPVYPALLYYQNKSDIPSQILNLLNEGELTYAGNFSAV